MLEFELATGCVKTEGSAREFQGVLAQFETLAACFRVCWPDRCSGGDKYA